jgi:hypothetical protein
MSLLSSTGFQQIHLFRCCPEFQTVYVLAGMTESMEIVVFCAPRPITTLVEINQLG